MQNLSPTSQLLMRKLPRLLELGSKQLLLVNPPADHFSVALLDEHIKNPIINSFSYDIYQYLIALNKDNTLKINFSAEIQSSDLKTTSLAIIFLPREKPLLDYLLAQTINALAPKTKIWLVGENRTGIKSAAKRLSHLSGTATNKLDSARHCSLLETSISTERQDSAHTILSKQQSFELLFNQINWKFTTLPGVFSYGRMDPASLMLLQSLEKQPVKGRVLDFACGCGVLGICTHSLQPDIDLDLLDVNTMALASTKINIHHSSSRPETFNILASDAYSSVEGRYNAIISNPPFHRETRQTLEVSEKLILQSPLYLKARGELRIVANRHLPYLKLFQQTFRKVEILDSDRNFHVILGKYPFTHRTKAN